MEGEGRAGAVGRVGRRDDEDRVRGGGVDHSAEGGLGEIGVAGTVDGAHRDGVGATGQAGADLGAGAGGVGRCGQVAFEVVDVGADDS